MSAAPSIHILWYVAGFIGGSHNSRVLAAGATGTACAHGTCQTPAAGPAQQQLVQPGGFGVATYRVDGLSQQQMCCQRCTIASLLLLGIWGSLWVH